MYDLLIKNGLVVDGTGTTPAHLDVAVSGGKIAALENHIPTAAKKTIDATNKIVTPGFFDVQNHSDVYWQLLEHPKLSSIASQGYTSILVGTCGASIAPLSNDNSAKPIQKWRSLEGLNADWRSVAELATSLNKRGLGTNVYTLVGYETLRRSLIGEEIRALSMDERKSIIRMLGQALREGAAGASFGLGYAHELTALEQELRDVCELVASHNKLVSIHLRSEGSHIIESIQEAIHLAEQTGVRLKISHLKVRGRNNWPLLDEVLHIIEQAKHRGVSVHFDLYPYDSTWQVLYNYLPSWATSGGREHMLSELRDPVQKRKIIDYIKHHEIHCADFILAGTSNNLPGVGKRLGEIATGMNCTSEEAALYLLEHGGSEVLIFDQNINPASIEQLLKHSLSLIATDGAGFPLPEEAIFDSKHDLVHPRCYGTAPTFLEMVHTKKIMSIESAIQKLTKTPADILGIKNSGVLKVGLEADIAVYNPDTISSGATLQNPFQQSTGIEHVLIHGESVIFDGRMQNAQPGRFITT